MKRYLPFLALFLSGCVPYQPVPDGYQGPLTGVINDTHQTVSGTKVYFFEVYSVNGRAIKSSSSLTSEYNAGRGFSLNPVNARRRVPAEKSLLRLRGVTQVAAPILAIGGGLYQITGDIEIDLLENERYTVHGELSESYQAVWLEDSNGNIVGTKIENVSNSVTSSIE